MTKHDKYVANVAAGMAAMQMVVYNERIAVVRDPEEDVSPGGIIIPDQAKRKLPRGTVVAVGAEVPELSGFQVGDRVMYTKYNPILFGLELPDGTYAEVELMHIHDLYLGWRAR